MKIIKKAKYFLILCIFVSCSSVEKNKDYYFIKGLNDYQKNDKVAALENYKKSYEKSPNNIYLLREIAYLYADLGDFDEAEKYYAKCLEINKNDRNAIKNLIEIHFRNKDEVSLKNDIEKILDKNSSLFYYANLKNNILKENFEEARDFLKKLIFNNYNLNEYKEINKNIYADARIIFDKLGLISEENQEIMQKIYSENSSNRILINDYSNLLIKNSKYDLAEKVLMSYVVSNEDVKNELMKLKEIYEITNNQEKLNMIEKILNR